MTTHTGTLGQLIAAHQAARDEMDRLLPMLPGAIDEFDRALVRWSATADGIHAYMHDPQSRPE